ncbi:diguanylate cyclase/phosphodiesterase [Rhizobiales bacterium GAS188]|jgi:EAL domain-containing protein (putative c-di-GMP-specific phosphodiesterase class I)/GGDEF domain-containing protein|nr:diguanylate cyclase/phosphodiesterase [Rhizobiales bacterium GAS188]
MNDISPGAAFRHARHQDGSSGPVADHRPVDPGGVLASLGFLAFSWDLRSGALSFVGDVQKVLPGDWGHDFESIARLEESQVSPSAGARQSALFGEERLDDGSGVPYALTYRLRSKDGRAYLVEESGRWFACLPGQPMSARGLLHVRGLPPELREDLPKGGDLSYRFLGRGALREVLERASEQAQRTHRSFALIAVVAAQGQITSGSELPVAYDAGEGFAGRLRRVMRRGDTLVRIDDQTSLCVLNTCDETQMATAVKRLETAFEFPEDEDGGTQLVGSVAGAVWKGSHANAQALATSVVDSAKAQFGASEDAASVRMTGLAAGAAPPTDWQKEILQALNERRLALACQPVVEAGSRKVAFHEGLLRLRNAAGRLLPASVFIPTSEENGLVTLLDQRVIELAAEALTRHPDLKLAINASALSLADPEWLAVLRSHASGSKPFAGRLILEVTESMALADIRRTTELLTIVKELGISVALDDFGSGHTSFRTLRMLPVDIIKIDGAFVQDVDRSNDGRFFIRTLVDLARHIGCKVVAEWVETEAAARIVEEIGVDYLQGRLIGTPKLLDKPTAPERGQERGQGSAPQDSRRQKSGRRASGRLTA